MSASPNNIPLSTSSDDKDYVARARAGDAGLGFFDREGAPEQIAGIAAEQLVSLYLQAADLKSTLIALVWPGSLTSIPLIHSLACFGLWANGFKRGVRGLYYPTKRNTFYPLNHIFISRDKLHELANRVLEWPRNVPNHIRESLAEKDSFLFVSDNIRNELKETVLRPCINELIPHFSIESVGDSFANYSDHFYFRLKSKLPKRQIRTYLQTNTFLALGNPQKAPDALFALGYKLRVEEIESTLRLFNNIPLPDVVVLDGTKQAVRYVPSWPEQFVKFIGKTRKIFGEQCPGFLVVTDEPRLMYLLKALLAKTNELQVHGIVHTAVDFGLTTSSHEPSLTLPERLLHVEVTDFEIGDLLDCLYALAKRLEQVNEQNVRPVWDARRYLRKLSHVPGNLIILWDYLNARDVDSLTRELFDWKYYRAKLFTFIAEGGAHEERTNLERVMEQIDKLIAVYQINTPLGLKVVGELQKEQARGRHTVVVVRSRLHRALLTDFLAKEGVDQDLAIVIQQDELETVLQRGGKDCVVFADMSAEILRRIVCEPLLPNKVVVLLTSPMAKQLKYTITPLLKMPEFKLFHGHLNALLTPLEEQFLAAGRSFLDDDGLVLPTFKLKETYDIDDLIIDDREAVIIDLNNLGEKLSIRRGVHSRMYVYDPIEAADGYSGFHPVAAEDLEPGQQVFLMSGELRELIENILRTSDIKVTVNMAFEPGLRKYHDIVTSRVNHIFRGKLADQVRMLADRIVQAEPSLIPEIRNLRHWINLGRSPDTPFEKLAPQAPRHFKAFQIFCKTLEIPDADIQFFWDFVIKPLRGTRRKEGRWLTDVYTHILFDPDSAIAYQGLSRETIDILRRKASENLFTVVKTVLQNW